MDKSSGVNISDSLKTDRHDRRILLVAKGGSILFAGTLFGYGSQLAIGILLTRLLGAEQFGQYKVAVTSGEIVAGFALLGMDYAMVRFVSHFASRRDVAGLWGTLQIGVGLVMLSSLLLGFGLFALASPLALYLFHEPQLIPLLRLASLIVPFLTISRVLAAATRGFNKMQYSAGTQQVAQPLIRLILLMLLAFLGLTAGRAIIPYIIGLIFTCVLLLYFLNHLFPLRHHLKTARRNIREILLFSLPVYLSSLLDTFGPNLQTVMLGSLNTITNVGIFAAATQASMASSMFNSSIGTASDPIISVLHSQGDREQMANYYKTTTKWMFTVNLPFFLILLLLSRPILGIFGKEFEGGSTALTILALASLVIAAAGISDGILAMTGKTAVKLTNSIVQIICTISLCFLLIPRWGVIGAAATVLITTTVVNLLRISEVFILFRVFPYNITILKPSVAGLIALAIGWLIRQLLHTETHLALSALNAFVILVTYVGMILLLGLSPEDQAVFAHLRKRLTTPFSRS